MLTEALATYRLTRLVVEDGITHPLRHRILHRHPPETSMLGYALTCPHCISMWAAPIVLLLNRWARPITHALALSAAVSLTDDIRSWAQVGHYTPETD